MSSLPPLKVLLFTKYSRMGASSRLRSLQYLPELKKANIEVEVSPLFDDGYLELLYAHSQRSVGLIVRAYLKRFFKLFSVFKYDLLWIEYELFPYLPAWLERTLVFLGVKYIVDYDDAVFHSYDLSKNSLLRFLIAKKIDKVMQLSTLVMAGNEYLRARALAAGARRVEWIATVIDISRYPISESTPDADKKTELVLGWIGSPATQQYLLDLKPVLEKICVKGKCKLHLVGAQPSMAEKMGSVLLEVFPWQEANEVEQIQRFDIGIMPLVDGPWEKGKCGYKLIQYMACQKPVLASAVGANIFIVENSESGLLADSHEAWLRQLNALIENETLRLSMGKKGRAAVENIYCLQVQAPRLVQLFRESV